MPHEELTSCSHGYGYKPYFVEGDDPDVDASADGRHARHAWWREIREIQSDAREHGFHERPRWPMIVLRTPKGWTGPKVVDGNPDRRHLPRAPGAA